MQRNVRNVDDPSEIPEVWVLSSKDHDRAAVTALVYLEHDGWDPVAADIGGTGGASKLPPPGTAVSVSWVPARLGGFRPGSFIAVDELRVMQAQNRALAAAEGPPITLEQWLAAMQSLGFLEGQTPSRLADLLNALDRYHDPDAGDDWDESDPIDRAAGADILWHLTPQHHELDREDPEYPLHGAPDDARLPHVSLVDKDESGPAQLRPLVGAVADILSDDQYDFDLESYVAQVRQAMTASGERRLPFLANGPYQSWQYIFLLDDALARTMHERKLLELYL